MIKLKNYKTWIAMMILISTILAISLAIKRVRYDRTQNNVEIAITQEDATRLGRLIGESSPNELINNFKNKGLLTTLLISEDTIGSLELQGKLKKYPPNEIYQLAQKTKKGNSNITIGNTYILVNNASVYDRILFHFQAELGPDAIKEFKQGSILEITATEEDIEKIGVGFDDMTLISAIENGWSVIVRLKNGYNHKSTWIATKIESIKKINGIDTILFEGPSILGYPNAIGSTKTNLEKNKLSYGNVEFFYQAGLNALTKSYPKGNKNIHQITEEEAVKLSTQKMILRLTQAATERSVDILLFHPLWEQSHIQNISTTQEKFLTTLTTALKEKNINVQKKNPPSEWQDTSKIMLFWISLGIMAISLRVLSFFIPCTGIIFWLGVSMVTLSDMALSTLQNQQLWGIIAAIIFPIWVVLEIENYKTTKFWKTFILGLICLSIAILHIVAIFFSSEWLTGAQMIRGIKLAYLLPLAFSFIYFSIKPQQLLQLHYIVKNWLQKPIKWQQFFMLTSLAILSVLLIWKSGNGAISLPGETPLREFLGDLFGIRPRTKDILGIASLILGVTWYRHDWAWPFRVVGIIGVISIINTFLHIHTPLMISIYRTLIGVSLGYALALIIIVFRRAVYRQKGL